MAETAYYLFHSMGQANRLRHAYEEKQNISYDMVLVTRPDIQFRTALDLEKILWQAEVVGVDFANTRFVAYTPSTNKHPQKLLINRVNDLIFFARPQVIDRYIQANENNTVQFMQDHALNHPSIYTAAELAAGIIPLHIAYRYKDDWANILTEQRKEAMKARKANSPVANTAEKKNAEKKQTDKIIEKASEPQITESAFSVKKIIKPIAKVLFYPLKLFYRWSKVHFQWLTQDD